jgi:hypothetical protein
MLHTDISIKGAVFVKLKLKKRAPKQNVYVNVTHIYFNKGSCGVCGWFDM